MKLPSLSRRRLLRQGTLAAALGGMGLAIPAAEPPPGSNRASTADAYPVRAFGAVGDGKTDDTASLQKALDEAGRAGGGVVAVPRGDFLIQGTLNVPAHVVVEGIFRAPTARTQHRGSTLLTTAGAGQPDGQPFITLHENSTLRGLTIFHPEQKQADPPVAYPWTVRGIGDNCSLVDVLLVNPYQAVDFGTNPCGRHFIHGLYAQALHRGIFVDQCFDVGRIEHVHLWPFWGGWEGDLGRYTREHGIAFMVGRTDWEYLNNCFCIGYRTGYQFVATKAGAPNAVLTQCGSDIGPCAVRVEASQEHAGVSFVNGQFMAGIEVAESNRGPLKFTACGFWGIPTTDHHALLAGHGHTTFNSCHFNGWAQQDREAACLVLKRGGLTVTASDFMDRGKAQVLVEAGADAAILFGNRIRGRLRMDNQAGERTQTWLNVVTP